MNVPTRAGYSWLGGALLIAVGLALLAANWFDLGGGLVVGALGAVFLIAYATTGQYGLLVPGMILGGLALGLGLETNVRATGGGAVPLGLGIGFLGIYVVDLVAARQDRWWPLIPGLILVAVGGSQTVYGAGGVDVVLRGWPVALIVVGALVLLAQRRRPADATRP